MMKLKIVTYIYIYIYIYMFTHNTKLRQTAPGAINSIKYYIYCIYYVLILYTKQ